VQWTLIPVFSAPLRLCVRQDCLVVVAIQTFGIQFLSTMSDSPDLTELNTKLKPLAHELRPDRGPCPFVVDAFDAQRVALPHYSGGRDATYVLVSRKLTGEQPPSDLAVTIRYAPFVEGTTVIYDLTDETMQGKARPFVCDLGDGTIRMYAVMPFQIESIHIRLEPSTSPPSLVVAFLDARGELIQAALPFELQITDSAGHEHTKQYRSTDRSGRYTSKMLPANVRNCAIRSLLTGREQWLTV